MKKDISVFLILFSVFLSFSCASKPLPIPGDWKNSIDNLYLEYLNIGDVYYSLEKYDKSLEYYRLAMENSKVYWAAYFKTAKVYAVQMNWDAALPMYRKLLRRDRNNDSIKASLAYIYAMSGKLKKAERAYKELVFLEPDSKSYLENLTAVYFAASKYDEGRNSLSILIEKFPDSESISKFRDLLKTIDDEEAEEVPLEEGEESTSVFDEELENPDESFETEQPEKKSRPAVPVSPPADL